MTMELVPFSQGAPTMSSVEIADLTGKRHDHVIRDIRNMLDELGGPFPQIWGKVASAGGRPMDVANLPRRECLILVSGYSVELRARIIDRWEQLEHQARDERVADGKSNGREARLSFKMGLDIAKMLGLRGNQALLSANGLARTTTGIDVLGAMGQTHLIAPEQEHLLAPTDIGRALGSGWSAMKVNSFLAEHGFQTGDKDHKGRTFWEPTEKGIRAGGQMLDVPRTNTTGTSRQLRWASGIVEILQGLISAA